MSNTNVELQNHPKQTLAEVVTNKSVNTQHHQRTKTNFISIGKKEADNTRVRYNSYDACLFLEHVWHVNEQSLC